MRIALWAVAGFVAAGFLHFLLLAMERRGWIFYVNVKAQKGAAGAGLLAIQELFEPGKKTYIERAQYDQRPGPNAGASPQPGEQPVEQSGNASREQPGT